MWADREVNLIGAQRRREVGKVAERLVGMHFGLDLIEGDDHRGDHRVRKERHTPCRRTKLGIAMAPEERQLFPSLSVEESLLIGG